MRYLPVLWSEGMFLCPQHFQALERSWSELQRTHLDWLLPYNYGLLELKWSDEALATGQLQINACRARMKDGSLVALGSSDGPESVPRVDLRAALEGRQSVQVLLAIPKTEEGRPTVGHGEGHRYVERGPSLVGDETDPSREQELSFRQLNVSILLSTADTSGYETLPILQVKRSAAQFEIDNDYIPPLLHTAAWSALHLEIIRAIYDLLGRKVEDLGDALGPRISFHGMQAADAARLHLATTLNGARGMLHDLTYSHLVHPERVYGELCRLAGSLTVFYQERDVNQFPKYDHDNLAGVFRWLQQRIQQSLEAIPGPGYERAAFTIADSERLRVVLKDKWLDSGWELFFGVRADRLTANDCRSVLDQLNWKLGGFDQVRKLYNDAMPDLSRRSPRTEQPPLPANQAWLFYTIDRTSPGWSAIPNSLQMGICVNSELATLIPGDREIIIKNSVPQAKLRFELFAVPPARI